MNLSGSAALRYLTALPSESVFINYYGALKCLPFVP